MNKFMQNRRQSVHSIVLYH